MATEEDAKDSREDERIYDQESDVMAATLFGIGKGMDLKSL